jgi:hypothetical protein|tara:strand:- start:709 stop:957 length:249 start_codon:yes stop_codon:yes gene_type:complete
MNEDYRMEWKLNERKICLGCFASNNIPITPEVYQFSHDLVESGRLDKYLPTKEDPLQEEVAKYNGDYFKMTCNAILDAWNER